MIFIYILKPVSHDAAIIALLLSRHHKNNKSKLQHYFVKEVPPEWQRKDNITFCDK